jgi:hypothetical protein
MYRSQQASRTIPPAWISLWLGIYQRSPVQRAGRAADRHHRSGTAAWHSDRLLGQTGRLGEPVGVRQLLSNSQHGPHKARLCRRNQRYCRDRSDDHAASAVGSLLKQKFANGQASLRAGQLATDAEFFYSEFSTMLLQSDWPTIRQFVKRWPSVPPVGPWRAPQNSADRPCDDVVRCSKSSRGRLLALRANPQKLRPQFPGKQSALSHWRGAVPA